MDIAIIGTGGVGGYFGAKLASAGNRVTFLARGKHLEAMQANGLVVKSIVGDFTVKEFRATSSIGEIGLVDLVLVCVKAWQVKEVRNELKSILHPQSVVIPLQNGVLAADELLEVIDKQHVVGGLCRIISKIEAPGVISHFGVTPTIVFGELDGTTSDRMMAIKQVFDMADIKSHISANIQAEIWKKFISICVSGLLAITKTNYGELRELPATRQMMIDLFDEVYLLAQRMDIDIEPDFVAKTVSFIDSFPPDTTSSLTRDVWDGKPSEIEYQNGTVVRLGHIHGVETPTNKFVYNCILPMEIKARGLSFSKISAEGKDG
jgi:2-dehydropantoate 2-reductase